jgi:hypothetical protein
MAISKKISEIELLLNPTGLEQTVVVADGRNHRLTLNTIKSLVTKTDLGLDKVNNTSDIEKPISALVALALGGKAPVNHTHLMSDVQGLTAYITSELTRMASMLAAANHTHQISDIIDLVNSLSGKASIADLNTLASAIANINIAISGKANSNHIHEVTDINNLLFTIDNRIVNKSNIGHTHDASAIIGLASFVQNIILNVVAGFSSIGHTHGITDVLGLSDVLAAKANASDITALSTLITNTQLTLGIKSNIGHTHSVNEILSFATEVRAIITSMALAPLNHIHTSSHITDLQTAVQLVMRNMSYFISNGVYEILPHGHSASQINDLIPTILAQLTQVNLQAVVQNIVNSMNITTTSDVSVGLIQW